MEETPVFENNTTYDKAAVQAMTWVFTQKVRRKRYLLRKGLYLGTGLLGTVCGLLLLFIFDTLDFGERLICIMALVVCVPATLRGLFLRRLTARRSLRALRQTAVGQERRFVFSEESFLGAQSGMETSYQYETLQDASLQDAYETEGYFVLRFDKLTCVILDKAGFTAGTAGGFQRFIERKLGKPVDWAGWREKNQGLLLAG